MPRLASAAQKAPEPCVCVCVCVCCVCVCVSGEGDDKYLIATSEQTLCALHRKGWFEKQDLPIK